MLEKSIIYLLFPTLFSSISVEASLDAEKEKPMSNQEIIEMGVEKVRTKLERISFDELKSLITNDFGMKKSDSKKVVSNCEFAENKCVSVNKKNFCLN